MIKFVFVYLVVNVIWTYLGRDGYSLRQIILSLLFKVPSTVLLFIFMFIIGSFMGQDKAAIYRDSIFENWLP